MRVEITGLKRLRAQLKRMEAAGESATQDVVGLVAVRTRQLAKKRMQDSPATGRTYNRTKPRRIHTASAASGKAYPRVDLGKLQRSIKVEKFSRKGTPYSVVGSSVPYAAHLEYGTFRMAARPWLMRSYRSAIRQISKELKAKYRSRL